MVIKSSVSRAFLDDKIVIFVFYVFGLYKNSDKL